MKKILRRSTLIYIVALAFIGGLGYLAFELVTGADDWVDQAYNAHIAGDGGLAQARRLPPPGVRSMTATARLLHRRLTVKEFITKARA